MVTLVLAFRRKLSMKRTGLILLCLTSYHAYSQIESVNRYWIDEVRNNKNNDTLYVINFWATWCKPCIEELPYFEKVNDVYRTKKVKVILVSNDMRKDVDTKVKRFINNKKITSSVKHMAETNADIWIEKVSKDWSGAIPATWFVRGEDGYEFFVEGEITYKELTGIIDKQLK